MFLKLLGITTQNLTARTTTISCFWGVFLQNIHCQNFLGEICRGNLPGEIWRQNLPAKLSWRNLAAKFSATKTLVKTNLAFGEKPPKDISLANSTRHRHISRTLPSLRLAHRKQAEVKGLCVFTLSRLERQARGTKMGTKVGVLCSLCSHVSLVGLSPRNCIRWRQGVGPSNSRLQREHSVVARVSKGGGGAML